MKSVKIKGSIDPKRKLLLGLYWTNKKTAVREGCDSFMIEKITTPRTIYLSGDKRLIKLSYPLIKDLLNCVENQESVEFDIKIGNEEIKTTIHNNIFYVSTTHSKELEDEIIEKMELESKKKFPNICSKFYQRLGVT